MQNGFRDWSDIRVFLAVVRAGSTLAASKGLGMAQPTVARRIAALEHALGIVLFERDPKGFRPTAEAQALIAGAEALERAAGGFAETAQRLVAGRSHTIRMTAFVDAFTHRLTSVIEAFTVAHPEVQFAFLPGDAPLDLGAGEADVALRVADRIDDGSLICRKIRTIGFSLFASKGYAAQHPLPSTEAGLADHRFAVYEGRLAMTSSSRWLLSRIDPSQISVICSHLKEMEAAVRLGRGIGPLPTHFGRGDDGVVACMALPQDTARPVWLLVNPVAWRRPEVRAFAAFFVPRYRAQFPRS